MVLGVHARQLKRKSRGVARGLSVRLVFIAFAEQQGGSPKKWQNFGKHFGFQALFFSSKSPANRLWKLLCTRQGSNLQAYDPKS